MKQSNKVGDLRQQCCFLDAEAPVELVTADPELAKLLMTLEIVRFYPNTIDKQGNWKSVFRIEVKRTE